METFWPHDVVCTYNSIWQVPELAGKADNMADVSLINELDLFLQQRTAIYRYIEQPTVFRAYVNTGNKELHLFLDQVGTYQCMITSKCCALIMF